MLRPPTPRRLRSLLAVAVVASALLVVPDGTGTTDASWTASEFGSGTLKAFKVPAPVMISPCTLSTGFAGADPVITVNWQFPAGTGYVAPANVNYYVASGGLLSNLTPVTVGSSLATTGPVNGIYTTQFKSGILSGLLGGSYGVYLQTKDGSGWVSTLATANASMGLAGINPVCTVQ
ncbi:hypothetical protein [Arthrobacter bambusae]|uniref:hypothetical protein n=1 Tax=Arthrobacter bambusae TaxID=1338426 RepID=UPI002782511E|nr:hypothetical protein [Arthrobacter bambusae]MDQ0032152.1 hypothetical protein [Arthrobacter bambusae]MDQ0097758.1 hypothetical protein [Arthrobacter bambusae]